MNGLDLFSVKYATLKHSTKALSALPRQKEKSHALPPPLNQRIPGAREADTLRAVLSVLSMSGHWHRRVEVQGVMTHSKGGDFLRPSRMQGFPDVIALVAGRAGGIAVKAPGGRLSGLQAQTLAALQAAGAVSLVVVSIDTFSRVLAGRIAVSSLPLCAGIPAA